MKTRFVTGASSGFGRAIAERFLEEGWRAIVCARRADRLQVFSSRFPDRVLPLQLDVTDLAKVATTIQHLPREFANIDVLVTNAGLARGLAPAHEASLDDWGRRIATTCSGLVSVTPAGPAAIVAT